MDRREFISRSCVIALGTAYFGKLNASAISLPKQNELHMDVREEIVLWNLLGRFAFAVGTSVVSSLISKYVEEKVFDNEIKSGINYSNNVMINSGFNDFSESTVHEQSNGNFMYSSKKNTKTPDICGSVFNLRRGKNVPTAMLEGPTLVGLVPIAEKFFENSDKADFYLMPIKTITQGIGTFNEGLTRPTIYASRGGNVKVNYQSDNNGIGLAHVSITDNNNNKVVQKTITTRYEI